MENLDVGGGVSGEACGGSLEQRAEIEALLYREARFADENRYDEWLALWDKHESLYWIPCNADDIDPANHISIAYDDRGRLEDRIFRLKSTAVHAQRPRSRMRRQISNVEIGSSAGDIIEVGANFILLELRYGKQDVFAGRCEYLLRRRDGVLHITRKKILLVNNDEFIGNLTFLL